MPVPAGMRDAKNVSKSASSAPSAMPVALAIVRMRPLTPTRYCVGPMSPIVSGGSAPVSARVATSAVGAAAVWATPGALPRSSSAGRSGSGSASGFCRRLERLGRALRKRGRLRSSRGAGLRAASAMISAVVRTRPGAPIHGCTGVSTAVAPTGPSTPATAGGPTRSVRSCTRGPPGAADVREHAAASSKARHVRLASERCFIEVLKASTACKYRSTTRRARWIPASADAGDAC